MNDSENAEVPMPPVPLPCVICGRELESALPSDAEEIINQPYAGTVFTSTGHYGSTIFDPMDGTYLEVSLCDPCVREAGVRQRVLHGSTHTKRVNTYRGWQESEDPVVFEEGDELG